MIAEVIQVHREIGRQDGGVAFGWQGDPASAAYEVDRG
jgi:hypothetical protein